MDNYPSLYSHGERISGKGRRIVLDSEAVGLLDAIRDNDLSSMHCIVVIDDTSDEVFVFFDPYEKRDPDNREWLDSWEGEQDGYLKDGLDFIREAEVIISQNFSGYDALAFERVDPSFRLNYMEARSKSKDDYIRYPNKVMDTLVMSNVLNPERKVPVEAYALGMGNVGAHSIEAHGIRMGRYKPDNEDWSKLTEHMLHRCEEDVHIGRDFYHYLMKEWHDQASRPNRMTGLTINTAYRNELQVSFAIGRQAQRGFRIDTKETVRLCSELDEKINDTEKQFRPHMPMRLRKKKLERPVNGHMHGSHYNTLQAITKKMTAKAWCAYSQSRDFIESEQFPESNYLIADNLLSVIEGGGKVSQKDWLSVAPVQQMNEAGEYSASVTKHYPQCRGFITDYEDPLVVGAFTPVEFEDVPLGNRDLVKQLLYKQGWLGINYNDTEIKKIDDGEELSPWAGKIDEDSIDRWAERGEVPEWCKGIAAWYILRSRRGQLLNSEDVAYYDENGMWPSRNGKRQCRGILPRCRNKELGMSAQEYYEQNGEWPTDMDQEWAAPAEAFSCATNTFRMRHKVIVNIPSRGLYPLRHLFIARKGKKILGCDGAGLELRMLAHFLADKVYQEIVLNGDIHTHNQNLAGLPKRDMAKTFIYAFLYGSGIANLSKVCGITPEEMEKRVARFKAELPALANLIERIQSQGEHYGYLLALDGRRGRIRSANGKLLVHTMLNVLLQMTGSISMKYGLCFAEDQMVKEGVGLDDTGWPSWLANVHDEMQMEVDEDEILEIEYEVSDWKAEEKREFYDDQGRMWSAPTKLSESEGKIKCKRYYHRAGQIIAEALVRAGEFLQLRCPLAGEYMIGDSWHDTH